MCLVVSPAHSEVLSGREHDPGDCFALGAIKLRMMKNRASGHYQGEFRVNKVIEEWKVFA